MLYNINVYYYYKNNDNTYYYKITIMSLLRVLESPYVYPLFIL